MAIAAKNSSMLSHQKEVVTKAYKKQALRLGSNSNCQLSPTILKNKEQEGTSFRQHYIPGMVEFADRYIQRQFKYSNYSSCNTHQPLVETKTATASTPHLSSHRQGVLTSSGTGTLYCCLIVQKWQKEKVQLADTA